MIETSPCFSHVNDAVLMLISMNLHMKSSKVSIKTRSTPASLSFKGQVTKHTTVIIGLQSVHATTTNQLMTEPMILSFHSQS